MKKYEVAIVLDTNRKEIGCFRCKLVDENEYKKLSKETEKLLNGKDLQVLELKKEIKELNGIIEKLCSEIKELKGE